MPDRHYQIDDMIAEADQVVCRMTVSGKFGATPERPSFPVPPGWVGVEGTVKHVHIFRITDGQITDHWAARDDLGMLFQLGAIAAAARA